jgi:hypothetical protein
LFCAYALQSLVDVASRVADVERTRKEARRDVAANERRDPKNLRPVVLLVPAVLLLILQVLVVQVVLLLIL